MRDLAERYRQEFAEQKAAVEYFNRILGQKFNSVLEIADFFGVCRGEVIAALKDDEGMKELFDAFMSQTQNCPRSQTKGN